MTHPLHLTESALATEIALLALKHGWRIHETIRRTNAKDDGFPRFLLVRSLPADHPGTPMQTRLIAARLRVIGWRDRMKDVEWLEALALAGAESYTWADDSLVNGDIEAVLR